MLGVEGRGKGRNVVRVQVSFAKIGVQKLGLFLFRTFIAIIKGV